VDSDCTIVESESFGEDSYLQIILPIATILIPSIQSIITRILERSVEIEWDGIKVKGTKKEVQQFLNYIKEQRGGNDHQENE